LFLRGQDLCQFQDAYGKSRNESAMQATGQLKELLYTGVASRDAAVQGKTLSDHLTHLLIHGYLHLLGHDHETPDDASAMEAREIRALASLDIANPYLLSDTAPDE
jgi:rRNA maturation RNase YbeY